MEDFDEDALNAAFGDATFEATPPAASAFDEAEIVSALTAELQPTPPAPKKQRAPRKKKVKSVAEEKIVPAYDSETSSEEQETDIKAKRYYIEVREKVSEATEEAKRMKIDGNPVAIYSEALDDRRAGTTYSATDFEFGKDAAEDAKPEPVVTTAVSTGEELNALAVKTMEELGVDPGGANRRLADRAIDSFQERAGRIADPLDIKAIRREMTTLNNADAAAEARHKWTTVCNDVDVVDIAGPAVAEASAKLRNRIESRSAEDRDRRDSVLKIANDDTPPVAPVDVPRVLAKEATGLVDVAEVRLSGTGRVESAQATTPAVGTEQRERAEKGLQNLIDRKVVVSDTTRIAKLATSVPPAFEVQGRHFGDDGMSLDISIFGDGTTVQSPLDFALKPIVEKSQTGEQLIHMAINDLYLLLIKSVKTFYDSYEVSPPDSEFRTNHVKYTEAFKHRVYEQIDRMYPKINVNTENREELEAKSAERAMNLREFFESLFAGMPYEERKQKLIEQLRSVRPTEPGVYSREALVNAVLEGAPCVAATESDVHSAVQAKAVAWQLDAQVESLKRQMPDISDNDLAVQISSDIRADHHFLLQAIKADPRDEALYTSATPITLERQTGTVYGDGNERNVVAEGIRLAHEIQGTDATFLRTARQETTRELRRVTAQFDELVRASSERALSNEELLNMNKLRGIIAAAKADAENAELKCFIQQLGHVDAATTVAAALKASEMNLETITRNYAADYMREPLGEKYGERPCANELMCICVQMASSLRGESESDRTKGGFVCREFLLPSQVDSIHLHGHRALPAKRQFCYLCHLYQTSHQYLRRRESQTGGERFVILQKFKTIFDKPGEYSSNVYNLAAVQNHRSFGIVAPFPLFSSNNYAYAVCRVTTHDKQVHTLRCMNEPEDPLFRSASEQTDTSGARK